MIPAHLTWLLSVRGGGIPPVVAALAAAQHQAGLRPRLLGVRDPAAPALTECGDSAELFPHRGPLALGFAPGLARALAGPAPDLLHLHGLFTWPSRAARRWGRGSGRPVLVTPHGMLEPWALAHSRWKKRLFWALVEEGNLRGARCLHALNQNEARAFRALGLRNPIAVIPNGVTPPAARPDRGAFAARFPSVANRRLLLFLGRIHPKKGLPILVEAWARLAREAELAREDWLLVVAGPDQLGHAAEVAGRVAERGLQRSVLFTGPLFGEAKAEALTAADAFVLPSHSEGFSMAVLEAMSLGLPVVVTRACNFDVQALGAGLVCDPEEGSLSAALRDLVRLPPGERERLGARGREEVLRRYTWQEVAEQVHSVYRWSLGGGAPPSSVELLE
ncbi:glycosyltransferase [Anaeromyxobacter paludicola]|uniref:Glycosyl transferase family 1 n=1 Tax=Anaeromyxobacter paludicola TaxID=2918171 RepID=A0ABM7XCM8_9BACT|nr:glycosyltransferase [Anaeromyxobacter paludicola]BDG09637.1 glycosyl transferase family 1 [Anaeromyxobacter paludicola]